MTLVSVCCPLFNKAPYIRLTVESTLAQRCHEVEMLVVDNGSTDKGPALVLELGIADPRVRLLSTKKRGPGHARNLALEQAQGEWILFLDADDLLEPGHLERLLEVARAHSEATVVAGGWKEFLDSQPEQYTVKRPTSESAPERLVDRAMATSPWAVHAAIIRREFALQHLWPEQMDGLLAEDNAFWFSICLHGNIAMSDSNGALYRTHTPSCRTQSDDIQKWYTGVNAAVDLNIAALRALGREPSFEQAESLMRLFSGLYSQAVQASSEEFAVLSAEKAGYWLRQCNPSTGSLLLRKIVGIQRFEKVRGLFG